MRLISVVIITQDEELRTIKAINSCKLFADEIIVIDGGSRDQTVAQAENLGCRVFSNPWPGYAKQRILGISKSNHEWIFMIDSDEYVDETLAHSIMNWKTAPEIAANAFSVDRIGDFLGVWLTSSSDRQIRLFNKKIFQVQDILVHERIDPGNSPVSELDGILWHAGFRSVNDHVSRFNKYTELEAQRDHLDGRKFSLLLLIFKPIARFIQVFIFHGFFRKGIPGFSVAVFKSFYDFTKELKLYEIESKL